MHNPESIAFEIRRPWPTRSEFGSARPGQPRWKFRSGRSLSPFWTIAGRGIYWPDLITVWHIEPGGRDSGEVCKTHWKWHVLHWRVRIGTVQRFRRWALTRCEWCGGKSRKGDRVNFSHSWDAETSRWWRGERGLFHEDCSGVSTAHATCTCGPAEGVWESELSGDPYGECATCGLRRAWVGRDREHFIDPRTVVLKSIPAGRRGR